MHWIKNISFYIVAALSLNVLSVFLVSSFLSKFLHDNVINILINLLAINTASTGIVLTKLKEISERHNDFDFSEIFIELKLALVEQIILIGLSIIVLIFNDSNLIKANLSQHEFIFNTLITAIFINALDTLRDTGKAIFLIIKK
jgi:NADH:ubiquinone oxidoreductase subunit 2 (subunit N)